MGAPGCPCRGGCRKGHSKLWLLRELPTWLTSPCDRPSGRQARTRGHVSITQAQVSWAGHHMWGPLPFGLGWPDGEAETKITAVLRLGAPLSRGRGGGPVWGEGPSESGGVCAAGSREGHRPYCLNHGP